MGHSEPTNVLEEYLNSPLVPTDDSIGYWNSFSTTPRTAPLARMALDVLSCPGELFIHQNICQALTSYYSYLNRP